MWRSVSIPHTFSATLPRLRMQGMEHSVMHCLLCVREWYPVRFQRAMLLRLRPSLPPTQLSRAPVVQITPIRVPPSYNALGRGDYWR